MTFARNLSILAEGVNASGVLQLSHGGTGVSVTGGTLDWFLNLNIPAPHIFSANTAIINDLTFYTGSGTLGNLVASTANIGTLEVGTLNVVTAFHTDKTATFGPSDSRKVTILPTDTDGAAGSPQTLKVVRVGSDSSIGPANELYVARIAWVLTAPTPSPHVQFNTHISSTSNSGANPGESWGLLVTNRTWASNVSGSVDHPVSNTVGVYTQVQRLGLPAVGIGSPLLGQVIEVRDDSNQPSAVGGQMLGLEIDLTANGPDNYGTGYNGRSAVAVILAKANAGGATPHYGGVFGVFSADPTVSVRTVLRPNNITWSEAVVDGRAGTEGAAANTIWLKTGQKIAFDNAGPAGAANTKVSSNGTTVAFTGILTATSATFPTLTAASATITNLAATNANFTNLTATNFSFGSVITDTATYVTLNTTTLNVSGVTTLKYTRVVTGSAPLLGQYSTTTAPLGMQIVIPGVDGPTAPVGKRNIMQWAVLGDTTRPVAAQNQGPSVNMLELVQRSGTVGGPVATSWSGSRTMLRTTWAEDNHPVEYLAGGTPGLNGTIPAINITWSTIFAKFNRGGIAPEYFKAKGSNFLDYGMVSHVGGATNLNASRLYEGALFFQPNTSVRVAYGWALMSPLTAGLSPVEIFTAYTAAGGGRTVHNWRTVFGVGEQGFAGLDAINGTLLAFKASHVDPVPTARTGADLRDPAWSGNVVQWSGGDIKGGTHGAAGTGRLRIGTGYLSAGATGLQIDATGYEGLPSGTILALGVDLVNGNPVTFIRNNSVGNDDYGGTYLFSSPDYAANTFRRVKVLIPPTITGTPPANPIPIRLRYNSAAKSEFSVTEQATTTSHITQLTATPVNYYVGRYLTYHTGVCAGERQLITAYDPLTKVVTTNPFSAIPTAEVNIIVNGRFTQPLPVVEDVILNGWQYTLNGGAGSVVRDTNPVDAVITGDGTIPASLDQTFSWPAGTDGLLHIIAAAGYRVKIGTARGLADIMDHVVEPEALGDDGEYPFVSEEVPFFSAVSTVWLRLENASVVSARFTNIRCADVISGSAILAGVRASVEAVPLTINQTWTERKTLTLQPSGGPIGFGGPLTVPNLFINSLGKIDFGAGDATITHSSDLLTFAGARYLLGPGTTDDGTTHLQLGGKLRVTDTASLYNFNATAVSSINLSGTTATTIAGTVLYLQSTDALGGTIVLDARAAIPRHIFRRANGTSTSMTGTVAADILGSVDWRGHDGTALSAARASIEGVAANTWAAGAQGANIVFRTTAATVASAPAVRMTISDTGNVILASGFLSRYSVNVGAATGTTITDALQLIRDQTRLHNVAAGTGVKLPVAVVGAMHMIYNGGANVVRVYANGAETIDGIAGATGVTLAVGGACWYWCSIADVWHSFMLGGRSA